MAGLVDVHLRELDPAHERLGELGEHRFGAAARRAPVRVEVDDDRQRRADHLGLEGVVGNHDEIRFRRHSVRPAIPAGGGF